MNIYIACLASYNAGILHGAWISAPFCDDDIAQMLANSPTPGAEEWAIHDHELGHVEANSWSLQDFRKYAELEQEHGSDKLEVVLTLECFENVEYSLEGLRTYDSEQEFCEEFIGEVPEHIHHYIDWSHVLHEAHSWGIATMELNGTFYAIFPQQS